jgi:hypothetical protein
MGYLANYIHFMSGTECPKRFLLWSALSLESAILGKKVWTMHGDYFPIHANLFVALVGTAASGKSTAKDFAKDVVTEHFPDLFISDDIQSREHICKVMTLPECVKTWKDEEGIGPLKMKGAIYDWRPFYAIVDELSLFVSVDAKNMVNFLIGIHSSKSFGTGFKKDMEATQRFKNPYFSLLACATPGWFMSNMKVDLYTGGLGRRLIIVSDQIKYEDRKPRPTKPDKNNELFFSIIEHLRAIEQHQGRIEFSKEAVDFWIPWYMANFKGMEERDEIAQQFDSSRPVQVIKVATLLLLDERPFKNVLELHHLQGAIAMFEDLEAGIKSLTKGVGPNITAGIAQQMVQYVIINQGMVQEKRLCAQFYRSFPNSTVGYKDAMEQLRKTEQLYLLRLEPEKGFEKEFVVTPEKYQEILKKQGEKK